MIEWRDTTSYSQDDKNRVPRAWEARIDPGRGCSLRVIVHRHRDFPPDQWLLSCCMMNIELHQLAAVDLEAAQKEALNYILTYAEGIVSALRQAIGKEGSE